MATLEIMYYLKLYKWRSEQCGRCYIQAYTHASLSAIFQWTWVSGCQLCPDTAHTHTYPTVLWLSGLCPGQPGWAGTRRNIHPLTRRGHQSSLICLIHLIRSTASSLFNPHAWQSLSTISLQVFFGLPLALAPSTSYSIHFFIQSWYSINAIFLQGLMFLNVNREIDWSINLRFYIFLDIKQVILEMLFPANLLASTDKTQTNQGTQKGPC